MAITTIDGLRAGLLPPEQYFKAEANIEVAGNVGSLFYASGVPGAGVAPSSGLNGAALTSVAGQLPYQNPSNGSKYLAGVVGSASNANASGALLLCDRLWQNSGIVVTTTAEQAITSPAWPARDRNGSTDGDGVFVAIEVSTALGNAGDVTNTTLNYTNSDGTAGRTGTITSATTSLNAVTVKIFELQGGDVGVRSVQGITLGTSYVSGVMHLIAFRPLAMVPYRLYGSNFDEDAIRLGLPRLYNDTVPFLMAVSSSNPTPGASLSLTYAQG